jgi:hypothetical protein
MPQVGTKRVVLAKPFGVLTLALAVPLAIVAVPAHAQGLFDFLRGLSQPVAPAPVPQPYGVQPDPFGAQPRYKPRPRPKPVAVEETEVKKPVQPRHPGEMENPFPILLADSTLRAGDMVMFPDGLRVFTGQPGDRHKLSDFKPLAQAGKSLSRETRKLVANLRPGENVAWSAESVKTRGKLAANTKDVEITGSVKRADGSKRSRTR